VLLVSKVVQDGVEYLVDKRTGQVYSSEAVEHPVVIGRWTMAEGVALHSHHGEGQSASDAGAKDEL
jgi:hypothetical protein